MWVFHCSGFSRCRARVLGCAGSVVVTGLQSVAHELSCPAVCEILFPGPEIEPMSPTLAGRFLTTGPPAKSLEILVFKTEMHWLQLHLYGHTTYPCFWMPAHMCGQRPHSPGLQGNSSPLQAPLTRHDFTPLCIPVTLCPRKSILKCGQNQRILHMSQDPRKVKGKYLPCDGHFIFTNTIRSP